MESVQVVSLNKKEVDDAVIEKAKTFVGGKMVGGAKICYLEGGAQVTFQCNRSVSPVAAAAAKGFRGRDDADAS